MLTHVLLLCVLGHNHGATNLCEPYQCVLFLLLQFFVVGHDCAHRSFCKNKVVEDIVGTLMFSPLIYPYEPWRIMHNEHHAHTNK
jgi:fatty acid desaturase